LFIPPYYGSEGRAYAICYFYFAALAAYGWVVSAARSPLFFSSSSFLGMLIHYYMVLLPGAVLPRRRSIPGRPGKKGPSGKILGGILGCVGCRRHAGTAKLWSPTRNYWPNVSGAAPLSFPAYSTYSQIFSRTALVPSGSHCSLDRGCRSTRNRQPVEAMQSGERHRVVFTCLIPFAGFVLAIGGNTRVSSIATFMGSFRGSRSPCSCFLVGGYFHGVMRASNWEFLLLFAGLGTNETGRGGN